MIGIQKNSVYGVDMSNPNRTVVVNPTRNGSVDNITEKERGSNNQYQQPVPTIHWKDPVPNINSLPVIGNYINDVRVVKNNGTGKPVIYICYSTVGSISNQWTEYPEDFSYTIDHEIESVNHSVSSLYTFLQSPKVPTIPTSDNGVVNKIYTDTLVKSVSSQVNEHNELQNIQGGNTSERYHLTQSEHVITITKSGSGSDGYLTKEDWNTFNNKTNKTYVDTLVETASGDSIIKSELYTDSLVNSVSAELISFTESATANLQHNELKNIKGDSGGYHLSQSDYNDRTTRTYVDSKTEEASGYSYNQGKIYTDTQVISGSGNSYNQSKIYTDTLVETVSSRINEHNELGGKQGGDGSDQYYHLSLGDYTNRTTRTDVESASGYSYNLSKIYTDSQVIAGSGNAFQESVTYTNSATGNLQHNELNNINGSLDGYHLNQSDYNNRTTKTYVDSLVESASGDTYSKSIIYTDTQVLSATASLYELSKVYTDTQVQSGSGYSYDESRIYTDTIVAQASGTPGFHNHLSGLDGGNGSNEYYHFSLSDYNDRASKTYVNSLTDSASAEAYNQIISQKGAHNGIATLGNDGFIPSSQIPALAITETFVVATTGDMISLTQASTGDVAIVTDINITYILQTTPPSDFNNWKQILTPASPVQSVNGKVGNVSLSTLDVPENTNQYFTTTKARNSISSSLPIQYDNSTGIISITQSGSSTDGFLSTTDWNIFNNKQNNLGLTSDVSGVGFTLTGGATSKTLTVSGDASITGYNTGDQDLSGYFKFDQTSPQTVTGGTPIFNVGLKSNALLEVSLNPTTISHLAGTAIAVNGADNSVVRFGLSSFGTSGLGAFAQRHARNTASSPQAVQDGDQLCSFEGWGYGATGYSSAAQVMARGYASETWTDSAHGTKYSIWTTPVGAVVPLERFKISNAGVVNIPNLTASKVVFTDASSNLTSTGIGTSSQFIKGDGSLDSSTYLTSVTAHNILSTTHGDTTADTVVRGDIITGQGTTPKWTRLAFPSTPTGKVLIATATDIGWSTNALGTAAYAATGDFVAYRTFGSAANNNTGDFLAIGGGTLTGNLLFTDNTYDIGATGVTRPRTGYFGTSIVTPAVFASANDSGTLGASGTAFSDLFLASGGVINWDAGNATITHSTGLLTLNVPLSLGTSNAFTCGTIELGATTDCTISRTGAGAIAVEGVAVLLSGGALGTPASGTVTNLTGTASININGTVGATTPASGVFTTLTANAASSLTLGTGSGGSSPAIGAIIFKNATNTNTLTIQSGTSAASVVYTLPTNFGAGGSVLTDASGNGTLSWAAAAGFSWGSSITGGASSSTGTTLTLENNSNAASKALNIVITNTQASALNAVTIDGGTSAYPHNLLRLILKNGNDTYSSSLPAAALSINDYDSNTNPSGTGLAGISGGNNFMNNAAVYYYGYHYSLLSNGAANGSDGYTSPIGLDLRNDTYANLINLRTYGNAPTGCGIGIVTGGLTGIVIALQNNTRVNSAGYFNITMSNTQNAAKTLFKIDLGSSAQAHSAYYVTGSNASTTAVTFNANMATGWTGKLFRGAVNSVEKFVVDKDGKITTIGGVVPRVLSAASYTTDTGTSLNCDTLDQFIVTAQAGALKFNNPTGTPTDGRKLLIAVTGTAARALTWDTQFEASTVALPTTTVTTARLNMGFIWRADTSKWVCIAAV